MAGLKPDELRHMQMRDWKNHLSGYYKHQKNNFIGDAMIYSILNNIHSKKKIKPQKIIDMVYGERVNDDVMSDEEFESMKEDFDKAIRKREEGKKKNN